MIQCKFIYFIKAFVARSFSLKSTEILLQHTKIIFLPLLFFFLRFHSAQFMSFFNFQPLEDNEVLLIMLSYVFSNHSRTWLLTNTVGLSVHSNYFIVNTLGELSILITHQRSSRLICYFQTHKNKTTDIFRIFMSANNQLSLNNWLKVYKSLISTFSIQFSCMNVGRFR